MTFGSNSTDYGSKHLELLEFGTFGNPENAWPMLCLSPLDHMLQEKNKTKQNKTKHTHTHTQDHISFFKNILIIMR